MPTATESRPIPRGVPPGTLVPGVAAGRDSRVQRREGAMTDDVMPDPGALVPGPPAPATNGLPDAELARTLDLLSEAVARYRVDDRRLTYCNRAWADQFRREPDDLIGTPIDELLNDSERAGLWAQLARLGPDTPFLRDPEIRPASRNPNRWVEWADRYLPLPGGAEVLAVGRDVTERHNAELRLAASEDLFRSLAEAATDLVWRLTAAGLTYVSPSVEALTGWRAAEVTGDLRRLRAVLDEHGNGIVDRALAGEEPPERFDMRMRRMDGGWVTLEMHVARLPDGWQGIGRDVTQLRRLQQELADLALKDPLTGLANRRLLEILLDAALARAERNGEPLLVSLVDLDDFKRVNDEHGHAAGDAVLRQLGQRLQATVRGADVVARLGGDEFVTVHEADHGGAEAILRRLGAVLTPAYVLPNGTLMTCLPSIGSASSHDNATAEGILAAADAAMYRAKREHRAARGAGDPA